MIEKKLPRDIQGIVFYVLGWVIGKSLKTIYSVCRFILINVYGAYKRDDFNRRLRFAMYDVESGFERQKRAFGREKLRFLAAELGLTKAYWHQSIALRQRTFEAIKYASEAAVQQCDLTQPQSSAWFEEIMQILFANFDRNLIRTSGTSKRRIFGLAKKANLKNPLVVSQVLDLTVKSNNSERLHQTTELSEADLSRPANSLVTNRLPNNIVNLEMETFPTLQSIDWVSDDSLKVTTEH